MTPPRAPAKQRDLVIYGVLAGFLAAALLTLFFFGPRWLTTPGEEEAASEAAAAAETRTIRARLLYAAPDGERLIPVEREVPYGEGTLEQAKHIIEAEIAPAAAPNVSPIPDGTKLIALFLTTRNEAYVNLSGEIRSNHPGGTTNEMLTVYALVNSLTLNLPAITGVQILVDGKEVDTLAGHLDLRRPLLQNDELIASQP